MSIKTVISRQLRSRVDATREKIGELNTPTEGWLRTVRKALGMSGAQLARRMGMTRGAVARNEKAEVEGGVTLNTMKKMATNMNCRFVYAVIPEHDVEEIMEHQAREKAKRLVNQAGVHMALEAQSLSSESMDAEVERLVKEILGKPSSIWDEA